MVFPARSALFNHNILNTKAISHFQANHILIRFVFPPLDAPDYVRLMNEIRDLKEKNRQLQQQVSENEKAVSDDNAGYADKLKRLAELVKYQLNPDRFVKVKFSDEVKIPINTLQLLIKKIDEEYVL